MPMVPMTQILGPAFEKRYGVGAFNIVNDITMGAVLDAAAEADSPVIIQISVKTVKMFGARLLQRMFEEMASSVPIPATLHLDHCPDVATIKTCLDAGWNSVLFDASKLSYEDNLRQTKEVVAMARQCGAAVEGELEAVYGVEDDVGSEHEGELVPLDKCVEFLDQTGIDSFAPAIGTAHGLYKSTPKIDFDRVGKIVALRPVPIVLHGGTGLTDDVFKRLIAAGCAKVNISTMLKITYCDGYRNYLDAKPQEHDPLKVMASVRDQVKTMAKGFLEIFGSVGKAGTRQLAGQSHG
ncbi:MAG: class II fructose-bisphosphate aldolase [Terracidiphilus sp.]